MSAQIPNDVAVFEDSGCRWMAYVRGNAGAAIVQADISSIVYSVFDKSDLSTATATGTLTVSSVIFDTLQTPSLDACWSKDSTGYNFGWNVPATIFATGDKTYRIEVKITPVSGEAMHLVRDFPVAALARS